MYKIISSKKASNLSLNFDITVNKWKKANRLEFLGIPTYWGSGLSEYKETRYEHFNH